MIKKRLLAVGLIATMCFAMTACGGKTETPDDSEKTSVESTVESETEKDEDDATTEEAGTEENTTVEDTTEPDLEEDVTDDEFVEDDMDMGVVYPNETVGTIFDSVKEALGDNYFPNMPIMDEMYTDIYGVNADDIEVAYGEMPMISANVDTFMCILAKEGKAADVATALNGYVDTMKNDSFQYPQNLAKMPAMEVVTHGDYVFLVATFGDAFANYDEPTDEQILEVATANVAKTKEAIAKCFE